MSRDDIRKLLGGYATGTLTPEEQEALFTAALEDQELFDALAREQSLRDLLRDPAARGQLLSALDSRAPRWYERLADWRFGVAAVAMAGVAVFAVLATRQHKPLAKTELAIVKTPPPVAALEATPVEAQPALPAAAVPQRRAATTVRRKAERPVFAQKRADAETALAPANAVPVPSLPAAAPAPPNPEARKALEQAVGAMPRSTPLPPAIEKDLRQKLYAESIQAASARDLFYQQAMVSGFVAGDKPAIPVQSAEIRRQEPQAQQSQTQAGEQKKGAAPAQVGESGGAMAAVSGMMPRGAAGAAFGARQVANLGVRYTVLRKSTAGNFVEADPADLKRGDTVALRFETNDTGFLSVTALGAKGPRLVFSRRMERFSAYTSPPLREDETLLRVSFSRQPQTAVTRASLDSRNRIQQAEDERAVYVVGEQPSPEVNFTITLKYR
jgi:hypothetical protein